MVKSTAILAAASLACIAGAASARDVFADPPAECRPETWFHFIGGNVAKEGITADLEAIAGAGISGVQLFHGQFGGPWPGVSPQITCLSAPWDGMVAFTAAECRRLGLRFTMQNCPGWATSGGPWIKPADAMRQLEWMRVDVKGGRKVEVKLPRRKWGAQERDRDYRDVAVLAFPAPAGGWDRPLAPDAVESSVKTGLEKWKSGRAQASLPGGREAVFEFVFARPVAVRTLELPSVNSMGHGWCYDPQTDIRFEAGGKVLVDAAVPSANWQDDRPVTYACDETVATRFKLTVKPRHGIKFGLPRLFESARNDDWEAQAGWTMRRLMRNPPRRQSPAAWVRSREVRNLTGLMDKDGTLRWDAPDGEWAVLRVGHVNTMRRNAPAPKEGTGFECDKMSARAADIQFDNYIGRLSAAGGPLHGRIDGMLIDSWECKRQTWTAGFENAFKAACGYDIWPWMPALFGYVVDGPAESARFLDDWRETAGDAIADNFYGRMARRCRERGISLNFETAFGDVLPGDIMRFFKYADAPMCEFWQPRTENSVGSFDFKPVKPAVSAAHLYGKRRVSAEAFTSFNLTWDEKLRDLKRVADIHIAEGVTHLVFHTYTHNPRVGAPPPGTSFGAGIGAPFLRGQTWWGHMPAFTAYLARCQAMSEAGNPVRDVLWHLGDEGLGRPPHAAPFPAGHRYDYCNPDALAERLSTGAGGAWTTPDGTAYRVLWLPDPRRMKPESLEKIADCAMEGAVAAFASLPEGSSTLRGGAGGERRFAAARDRIAAIAAGKAGAKGRIYIGRGIGEVLAAEKTAPDVEGAGVLWNHRRNAGADWYFVTPEDGKAGFDGTLAFRAQGIVEIWRPLTGERRAEPRAARMEGGRTRVPLSLERGESCFVVFKKTPGASPFGDGADGSAPAPAAPRFESAGEIAVDGWTVSFPAGWGMPEEMRPAALKPWKELGPTPEAKAFSGTAVYKAEFDVPAGKSRLAAKLDLGRVESLAKVKVNGVEFPALWTWPYSVDVSGALKEGRNEIEIEITDTWFNRLAYDAGLPEDRRRTWTICRPRARSALRDSGLLGPVKLQFAGGRRRRRR